MGQNHFYREEKVAEGSMRVANLSASDLRMIWAPFRTGMRIHWAFCWELQTVFQVATWSGISDGACKLRTVGKRMKDKWPRSRENAPVGMPEVE